MKFKAYKKKPKYGPLLSVLVTAKKAKQILRAGEIQQEMADKLVKKGWNMRPVEGADPDDEFGGKRVEWFKGDLSAPNNLEACKIQKNLERDAKQALLDFKASHLALNGWEQVTAGLELTPKGVVERRVWRLPHWERSDPGFYVVNLKRAYRQQLKFDAEKLEEASVSEDDLDL